MSDLVFPPNFTRTELQCPCCGLCDLEQGSLWLLGTLREAYGKPIKINSGFRCPKHNTAIGGVVDSQHLKGRAFDINCADSTERFHIAALAIKIGFRGIGAKGSLLHIDNREGNPVFFTYGV